MFARVSWFEGRPEQADELVDTALEKVLPQLKRYEGYDGFNGALALADRGSGKVLTILLWESEEASYWYRRYSAEAAGEKVKMVERYEVVFSQIMEAKP